LKSSRLPGVLPLYQLVRDRSSDGEVDLVGRQPIVKAHDVLAWAGEPDGRLLMNFDLLNTTASVPSENGRFESTRVAAPAADAVSG
jgi:hypothetical protein